MATATWHGAVDFAGFPVNVAVYPTVKSRDGESFKMITPDGKAVEQWYQEAGNPDGKLYKTGELGRGVLVGNEIKVIPEAALEQISEAERSSLLEATYFAPFSTIPIELANTSYSVVPDPKVAGADKSVNALWNYLHDSGNAYVAQVTFRSGKPDAIFAIYATEKGLAGVTLPFADSLHPAQPVTVVKDDKQAKMLAKFVSAKDVKAFSFDDFTSTAKELRAAAVAAALDGKPMPEKKVKETKQNDLMAALEAQLASA